MSTNPMRSVRPSRRAVLRSGLALVASPYVARGSAREEPEGQRLVLLHLSGGNDGLNTVIPYSDPMYSELRPRLGRVARHAIPIDRALGLHPALAKLARVFEAGDLAIIQGVGLPEPDYSHVGSVRMWARRLAWTAGPQVALCATGGEPWPVKPADYVPGRIAKAFEEIGRALDEADGPAVIRATVGGFDTHADQLDRHECVLRELDNALAEFHRALRASDRARRVILIAWSEFGRRPAENASGGSDHGWAGPVFVLGPAIRGGLYGRPPSLTETDFGNLIPTVELGTVCRALAAGWLGLRLPATDGCRGTLSIL